MIEDMVKFACSIAEDDSHGYSQAVRWGPDYDCSSLMITAANVAGYNVPTGSGYTGTMLASFTNAGFTAIPFQDVGLDGLIRGDILLNVCSHTEMYIGNKTFVGAHIAETGGIYGAVGDQTGNEIGYCPAYNFPWDYVLRPPTEDGTSVLPTSPDDDILNLARDVIKGKYGSGQARRDALGDKYDEVQALVNRLLNTTGPVPVTDTSNKGDFTVTCRSATIWRTGARKESPAIASYAPGAVVECINKTPGQDPYGDGRNLWYQSKRRGLYCWQGTIE